VTNKFERRITEQMQNVRFAAREEIIEANDLVAFVQKPFAKVRADKTGSAGDEYAHIVSLTAETLRRRDKK
jgi:hypothetical protein